jgi:DNA-binding CsgD family transcriptional regulator
MARVTLVERDRELTTLRAAWREARLGRGSMLVVAGDAGAGKTILVQHLAGELATDRVLWGACDPLATPRPLGPFHDMSSRLAAETARHLREAAQPHEIFAAVHAELQVRPSLLVVEDLHWADQGTIDLLRFLLRRIESTGSLVIATVRDDELGLDHPLRTLLGDAARTPRAGSLPLAPLSVEGIALLAGERDIDPARLHLRTGGNAFFVAELLDHGADDLPATIRDAVLARTVGLSSDAWDLLHLLACAPEAIPDQLLVPLNIGLAPLRSLHERGLISRGPRGVTFRHDLSRLAVASTVPPGIEPTLHRRLLDALEAFPGSDPAVLAHHALGAGDAAAILRHSAAAGRNAARSGAHTQAAEFYARALERAVAAPAVDRAELLEAAAIEYYLIDRLDDAITASNRAMRVREEADDRVGMATNHHALAVYHWYNAERQRAEEHANAAVALLAGAEASPGSHPSVLGHAFAMQAFLSLHASDLPAAREHIALARTAAASSAEPTIGVRVEIIDGLLGVVEGNPASRSRMATVLERSGDDYDEIYSSGYSNLGFLDVEQRRFGDAADLLERSISMSVERDLPVCRVWQIGARGRLKLLTGDWDGALTDADDVLSGRSAPLTRFWPHLERAIIGLRRHGDPGGDLDAAWELANRYGERLRWLHAAAAIAERAWLTGRHDDRLDGFAAVLAEPPAAGQEWARGELAMWLHRVGVVDGGRTPGLAAPYAREVAGDGAGAAAAWHALGMPFEEALALAAIGDADAARTAVDALDRLGADAVAAKVRALLRADGIVSVPARRRATTRAHPAGLTARQGEVLRQMSLGLTNAELAKSLYISAKTVDHHVSAILTKLGVPNRREAVRAARDMGLLD